MPIIGSYPQDDAGYLALLSQKLLDNERGENMLHMLQAGDGRELAVQVVREDNGSYRVIARRMVEPVFATAEDYRGLEVATETLECALAPEAFQQLDSLWREFLFSIRVPTSLNSFDRPHYYFSGIAGPLRMTGYADGPKPGTCLAQLRDVGELLFALPALSDAERGAQLTRLTEQVAALSRRRHNSAEP